jgi:hypothetical protein
MVESIINYTYFSPVQYWGNNNIAGTTICEEKVPEIRVTLDDTNTEPIIFCITVGTNPNDPNYLTTYINGNTDINTDYNDKTRNPHSYRIPGTSMSSQYQLQSFQDAITNYPNYNIVSTSQSKDSRVTTSFGYSFKPGNDLAGTSGIPNELAGKKQVICEIIGYSSVLSTSDRQHMEGYLANKWGVKSLISSNPYSTTIWTIDPVNLFSVTINPTNFIIKLKDIKRCSNSINYKKYFIKKFRI